MPKRDYYEILGVGKNATADEIKKAFRKAAVQYHPDKAKGEADKKAAEVKFKEVNEAYDVLKDPQKKAAYDAYGHAAFEGPGAGAGGFGGYGGGQQGGNPFGGGFGFDFGTAGGAGGFSAEDIFETFFGGTGRSRSRQAGPTTGRDLHYSVTIPFDKAVRGGEENIKLGHLAECPTCHGSGAAPGTKPVTCDKCGGTGEIQQTSRSIFGQFTTATICPKCQGSGQIIPDPCKTCGGKGRVNRDEELSFHIPAGVDTGTEMRFAGKGDAGRKGGRPGDLYLEFKVQPHHYFMRRGNDIYLNLPLNLSQAALGTTVKVPTIDGEVSVKVPAGTRQGTEIRLSGKGVPRLNRAGRGDQFLIVMLILPQKLSGDEKRILEQLAKVEAEPEKPWS